MEIDVAEEYVVERDQGRFSVILAFLDKKPVNIDYLFDATINRKSYSIQEVSDLILSMYEKKVSKQMAERKKEPKFDD